MKTLRKIDSRIYRLQQLSDRLAGLNVITNFTHIDYTGKFINFFLSETKWSVWISLSQLASYVSPNLSGMHLNHVLEQAILDFISLNTDCIISIETSIPFSLMERGSIEVAENIHHIIFLKVKFKDLIFYVEDTPQISDDYYFDCKSFFDFNIPVSLKIGHNRLKLSTLREIQSGDILKIQNVSLNFFCSSTIIPIPFNNEISCMIDKYILQDEDINSSDFSLNDYSETVNSPSCNMEEIHVNVDMVILSKKMTLREVNELQFGKTLILPEDAHKKVAVKVNEKLIAIGELVEYDEKLAIEIASVFIEANK